MTNPAPGADPSDPAAGADLPDPAAGADLSDAATVQAAMVQARARLLGGRGSGASRAEVDRHTRGRSQLGGEPTAHHLGVVGRQTAIARGDAADIALDIATARDQLARSLQAIRAKISPPPAITQRVRAAKVTLQTGQIRRSAVAGGLVAGGLALAATVVVVRRHRRRVGSTRTAEVATLGRRGPLA